MYESAEMPNHFKSNKRLPRPAPDEVAVTLAFSREETSAVLSAVADHPRDAAIVQILFDTGMRISEVLAIRRSELDRRREGQLYLISTVKKKGRVETAMPASSRAAVDRWLEVAPASTHLFPGRDARKRVTSSWFRERLEKIGKIAGVANTHPHRFRATYITEAFDAGVPLREIQASVHHADPKTTIRYDRGVRGTGVTSAVAEFRKNKEK